MNETGHYHVMRLDWGGDYFIGPEVYGRFEDADAERVYRAVVEEPEVHQFRVYLCDDPGHFPWKIAA